MRGRAGGAAPGGAGRRAVRLFPSRGHSNRSRARARPGQQRRCPAAMATTRADSKARTRFCAPASAWQGSAGGGPGAGPHRRPALGLQGAPLAQRRHLLVVRKAKEGVRRRGGLARGGAWAPGACARTYGPLAVSRRITYNSPDSYPPQPRSLYPGRRGYQLCPSVSVRWEVLAPLHITSETPLNPGQLSIKHLPQGSWASVC